MFKDLLTWREEDDGIFDEYATVNMSCKHVLNLCARYGVVGNSIIGCECSIGINFFVASMNILAKQFSILNSC